MSSISAVPITPNEVATRIVAISKSRPELLSAAVSQADPDLLRVALTHADPDLLEVALTKSQANLLGTALTSGVRAELLRTAPGAKVSWPKCSVYVPPPKYDPKNMFLKMCLDIVLKTIFSK